MIAVIQRVSEASVTIENRLKSKINHGLLILLGVEDADQPEDVSWLVSKISQMRIFSDSEGKMNLNCLDIDGEFLVVSQFTLHASTKKGNRPSFIKAAKPEVAIPLYELFISKLGEVCRKEVKTGEFGADMKVAMINDGPVTIIIDSKDKR